MINFKGHKGITLIALIITIIVLLILAGITISQITGQDSAPDKAVEARKKNEQGAEFDAIKVAVVGAVANGNNGLVDAESLKNELNGLVEDEGRLAIRSDNAPWVVVGKSGKVYEITSNAIVTELSGIVLTPKNLILEIENDAYEEKTVTARLIDIEGTITWSNSTEIIDITPSQDGKSAVIKAKKEGTETVTVTCSNGETEECKVTVTKEANPIGEYVDYGVSYTDMNTEYGFTSSNGWRIINPGTKIKVNGKTEYIGTQIISTGIPANLYYSTTIGTNGTLWWGDTGNINQKVTYGMKYNFKSIPFAKLTGTKTNADGNEAIYKEIINSNPVVNVTDNNNGSIFITDKAIVNDDAKTDKIESVHILSLKELNECRNLNENSTTSTATTDGATGLFALKNLKDENSAYLYTNNTNCEYWLATIFSNVSKGIRSVISNYNANGIIHSNFQTEGGKNGIRIIITLNSNIYKDGNIWKIK